MTTLRVGLSEEAVQCCGGPVVLGDRVRWFVDSRSVHAGSRPSASRHADPDHDDVHPVTGRVARIQVVSQLHHEVDTAEPDQAWTWFAEHGGRTFVPVPGSERLRDVDTAPAGSEVFDVAPGRRQRTYRCDAHWTVDLDLDDPPPWLRSAPSGV